MNGGRNGGVFKHHCQETIRLAKLTAPGHFDGFDDLQEFAIGYYVSAIKHGAQDERIDAATHENEAVSASFVL